MAAPGTQLRVVGAPGEGRRPFDLEEAFRGHAAYVAGVGLRILGRGAEVDDLVQDVFIAAARGLRALREPAAARAWLRTVAVRLARRRLRARRLKAFIGFDDAPSYLDVADPAASPADRQLLASVYRLLDRLPVSERLAWTLRHVEGEALDDVAAACGCSLATAKRRVAAAQQAIEREFDHG